MRDIFQEQGYPVTCMLSRERKLCYIPIHKNASNSYTTFFGNHGWEKVMLKYVPEAFIKFAHIRDPHQRLLRGLVQFMKTLQLKPEWIDDPLNARILMSVYHDPHIFPISHFLGEIVDDVTFIPIDRPELSNEQITLNYLKPFGFETDQEIPHANQAQPEWIGVHHKLRELFEEPDTAEKNVTIFNMYIADYYRKDEELYQKAVEEVEQWM